jgi:hypothetical protein
MANRITRSSAVLLKIEAVIGTDSVPTGGANAMLVGNIDVRPLVANNVNRDRIRAFIGGNADLVGTKYKEISFDVEAVGSGTAGVAPAWGPALRACAMAETVEVDTRVDYTPITDNQETVTIYAWKDGVRHILLASKGEWGLSLKVGDIPKFTFRFMGLDGGESVQSNPAVTLTGWRVPQVLTDAFTADLVSGGTCSTSGAVAITGGTEIVSDGFELQSGNAVTFTPLIGLEAIDVTAREVVGSTMIDETATQEVARMALVRANALATLSLEHGTVPGDKLLCHLASAQFSEMSYAEVNNKLMQRYSLRAVPVNGNDEVRIVTSY